MGSSAFFALAGAFVGGDSSAYNRRVRRAMWDEVRRAFAMTFPPLRTIGRGALVPRGGSWTRDPHLLRGYLTALPVVLVGGALAFALGVPRLRHDHAVWPFLVIALPFALVANVLWFYVAARSRAREAAQGSGEESPRTRTP